MDKNAEKLPIADETCCKEAVVAGKQYRFTILTDCLIRMEYQEAGEFVDEPTQTVICRDFSVGEYRVMEAAQK